MERRRLGRTGLHVSRLALGTMTWGGDTDEAEAGDQLAAFLDAGGTLVDTADVYSGGRSEEILGALLRGSDARDEVVIATKAVGRPGAPGGRSFDASRRHLLRALDASLDRLGVGYIDLWQLHAWDPLTPLDETLAAVETAVSSGRTRYVGVSNYSGWQLALAAAGSAAAAPVVAAQHEYSLLERGIDREVVPAALELGIGVLPWSPLGRGVLTGKYRHGVPAESRAASTQWSRFVRERLDDDRRRVVDAVATAADGLGVTSAEVALAWVRDRPGVVAPVLGARTAAQLRTSLLVEGLELPIEIREALDDVSAPDLGYPDHGRYQPGE